MRFILLALVFNLAAWFVADGLIWLELHMKPYTPWGQTLLIWGQHFAFFLVATWFAFIAILNRE